MGNTIGDSLKSDRKIDTLSCYCVMRHINAYIRQTKQKRTANHVEACDYCPMLENETCNAEWFDNLMPISKKSGLMLNLSSAESSLLERRDILTDPDIPQR